MNARVLVIDHYDSFTFNLVQCLRELGAAVEVRRHDAISLAEVTDGRSSHVVLAPGPGRPADARVSLSIVRELTGVVPILGVCLGHQALAAAFGARVSHAKRLVHGQSSLVYHDHRGVYQGLPNPFSAGRYHSLAVLEEDLPDALAVTAYTSDGEIMGLRDRTGLAEGIQFHPESVLTPEGKLLVENFLEFQARVVS